MNPEHALAPEDQELLRQLIEQVQNLTTQNQSLAKQLNQMQSTQSLVNPDPAQSRLPVTPVQIKFQDVEKFNGSSNVMAWLDSNRRRHNSALYAHLFPSDADKIAYASLRLEGDASIWFSNNQHSLDTWTCFEKRIATAFQLPRN